MLNWLADQAARAGVHLVADFRATPRNRMMEVAYRFAGFADSDCDCVAGPTRSDEIRRFHLVPESRPGPETMRLVAPDLSGAAAPAFSPE
jgi:methoxymalonate biosynthesis protein